MLPGARIQVKMMALESTFFNPSWRNSSNLATCKFVVISRVKFKSSKQIGMRFRYLQTEEVSENCQYQC
jgi:hypothetical protein